MPRRTILNYNPSLKERARELRKNMTETEKRLWSKLRKKQISGLQFYRQRPIGNYVVDFYCPDTKLVVEADGQHHFTTNGLEYDREKDAYLRGLELTVLRFSNEEINKNIDSVLNKIRNFCI